MCWATAPELRSTFSLPEDTELQFQHIFIWMQVQLEQGLNTTLKLIFQKHAFFSFVLSTRLGKSNMAISILTSNKR